MNVPSLAHDLFLLMVNLSRLRDREQIIELFCGAVAECGLPLHVRILGSADEAKPEEITEQLRTDDASFRAIAFSGDLDAVSADHLALLRNGVRMLGLILRNRAQEDALARRHLQTREELAETRHLSQRVLDTIPAMVYLYDFRERRCTYISQAVTSVLGYQPEQLTAMGSDLFDRIIHPDDLERVSASQEQFRNASMTDVFEIEYRVRAADGTDRMVFSRESLFTVDDDGVPRVKIGSAIDITDRHLLEQRMRSSQKMEAIGQLAGGVAHDFNNMLNAILGAAEMLSIQLPDAPAQATRSIEIIRRAVGRAAGLTNNLLMFSRRSPSMMTEVDPADVIREVTDMVRSTIDRAIRIETSLEVTAAVCRADPSQLHAALLNLCLNARDAMPDGGLLSISLRDTVLQDANRRFGPWNLPAGRYVAISVKDSGKGMPAEVLEHIFEPFFTTKGVGEGTGLGLASVYGVVKDHHGGVRVTSTPGRGSEFTIYLPAVAAAEQNGPDAPAPAPLPRGRGRILVVDDEDVVREVTAEQLASLGYEPVTAANGVEALARYRRDRDRIDLVLLDLSMPQMGGAETFRRLRAIAPELPIIVCSGYGLTGGRSAEDFARDGELVLQKPIRLAALAEALRRTLA